MPYIFFCKNYYADKHRKPDTLTKLSNISEIKVSSSNLCPYAEDVPSFQRDSLFLLYRRT